VLEALEERATPAALAPVTPVVAAAGPPTAAVANDQALVTAVLQQPLPAPLVANLPAATGSNPAAGLATLPSPIDQASIGFPGRIAFPGTGLTQRSATGSGPFTQPPGLFLPGAGSDAVLEQPAPRPAPVLFPVFTSEELPGEGGPNAAESGQGGDAQPAPALDLLFSGLG
jgi:hypothetical protein